MSRSAITNFTILVLIFLNTGFLMAQSTVKGELIADGKQKWEHAMVYIKGTEFKAELKKDDKFQFDAVPAGHYFLVAVVDDFEPVEQTIFVQNNEMTEVRITLTMFSIDMPGISVVAKRDGMFQNVPGSVGHIGYQEIQRIAPVSANEVLRRISGVHVVDEEGAGMRVNIGVRGLDPDRSRSVLVLEDGIPVALGPYGEPEMYYSPVIDRMAGIEVLKGSGSILYGPQTIGGVVNYITADPPAASKGSATIRGGQGGFFSGLVNYGNTYGRTGVNLTVLRKQAKNYGPTSFAINDINGKIRMQLSEKSSLGLRIGIYDETSNSTYIGITQAMFDKGGNDFTRLAPNDLLLVRRYSTSLTHSHKFNDRIKLSTTVFGYTTVRNWRRQDFTYSTLLADGTPTAAPSTHTGVTWGDTTVAGGGIYMRSTTGNRNRQFEVAGIESRLTVRYEIKGVKNEVVGGARLMAERAFEQRINGTKPDVSSGTLREDEIRTGMGYSAFIHNQTHVGERFIITAGTRFEYFDYTRNIRRGRYNGKDVDTSIVSKSNVMAVIPGLGFNYTLNEEMGIFGGIHRGFAPPRIKDAISNDGTVYELDAEKSWNTELGFRTKMRKGVTGEICGFYMDFANQIIPVSESSGGAGSGLINAGETVHYGAEVAVGLLVNQWIKGVKDLIRVDVSATWVQAYLSADRFPDGSTGDNIKGNRTPYTPEWWLNSAISWQSTIGLGMRVGYSYTGQQFGDVINSTIPSNNGQTGLIPAYHLVDGTLQYESKKLHSTFTITGKNLLNERYIASRRPQGIRVGMPRMITLGWRFDF